MGDLVDITRFASSLLTGKITGKIANFSASVAFECQKALSLRGFQNIP
jgi:hypothetical protein